jgi:hypothetical protein
VSGASPAAPWFVYRDAGSADNHGWWANLMPAGADQRVRIDLANASGPASGATAIRLDLDLAGPGWLGLAVSSEPGYWGDRPGPGFDLSFADALVFAARGAAGGERLRIKAAVTDHEAFGDSAALPLDSGWITLSQDWQSVRIPTEGRNLARVVTPFVLIANRHHNPAGRLTVFLDDIRYEAAP